MALPDRVSPSLHRAFGADLFVRTRARRTPGGSVGLSKPPSLPLGTQPSPYRTSRLTPRLGVPRVDATTHGRHDPLFARPSSTPCSVHNPGDTAHPTFLLERFRIPGCVLIPPGRLSPSGNTLVLSLGQVQRPVRTPCCVWTCPRVFRFFLDQFHEDRPCRQSIRRRPRPEYTTGSIRCPRLYGTPRPVVFSPELGDVRPFLPVRPHLEGHTASLRANETAFSTPLTYVPPPYVVLGGRASPPSDPRSQLPCEDPCRVLTTPTPVKTLRMVARRCSQRLLFPPIPEAATATSKTPLRAAANSRRSRTCIAGSLPL